MREIMVTFVIVIALLFSSCATIIPVRNPDMTRDEYAGLIAAGSERTVCYEKGFRGGMLLLDIILGAPFVFAPVVIDAAGGKFTAYYYHHNRCEKVKAQERNARLSRDYGYDDRRPVEPRERFYQEPDPAYVVPATPAASMAKPVESGPREETAKETDPAPVKEEDEYEDLY